MGRQGTMTNIDTAPTKIFAIVPAAGVSTNGIMQNSSLPDAMLPINGKPVIGYIVEDLLERGIFDLAVILSKADTHTEKYLLRKFQNKTNIKIIYNDKPEKGVGYSVNLGVEAS